LPFAATTLGHVVLAVDAHQMRTWLSLRAGAFWS